MLDQAPTLLQVLVMAAVLGCGGAFGVDVYRALVGLPGPMLAAVGCVLAAVTWLGRAPPQNEMGLGPLGDAVWWGLSILSSLVVAAVIFVVVFALFVWATRAVRRLTGREGT